MAVHRRYPEIYDWTVKKEQEGRNRIRTAPAYGIAVAALCFIAAVVLVQETFGALAGVVIGSVLGAVIYQWRHDSGLRMVLDAQQMLVAIDTEHNTREIVDLLKTAPVAVSKQVG